MPADIRSFFGGGPKASQGSQSSQKKDEVCWNALRSSGVYHANPRQKPAKKAAPKKSGRASRVVMDESDDDDEGDVK